MPTIFTYIFSSVKNLEIHQLGSHQLCSQNITRIPSRQWCKIRILPHSVLISVRNFPDLSIRNVPDTPTTRPAMRKGLRLICINPNYKQPPGKAELPHLQVVRTPREGHRHRNYKLISSHNLSGEISLAFSAELFYCFLPPGNVWLVWPGGTLFIYSTKRGKKYLYPTLTCIYHLLLCEISKPVLYG